MNIKDIQIAIVGGGPGGLTLARLLQMQGAQVKVYERDFNQNARVQGANLDLHEESGLAALAKANLTQEFYAHHLPNADRLQILDMNGKIHMDEQQETPQQSHRPEIDRGPLRQILLDSLVADTVVWNSHFLKLHAEQQGWRLVFKNGTSAYADVVIGADGANSKIRPYLSDTKMSYAGITIIEGHIPNAIEQVPQIVQQIKGGKIMAFGEEKSIIISQKGDGSLAFYTGEKVAEQQYADMDFKNSEKVKAWLSQHFSNWNPIFHELFQADQLQVIPRTLYYYNYEKLWESRNNLSLIGDAAHLMPPYTGEGVNMAMLDALKLSEALSSAASLQEAIQLYESEMWQRAQSVSEMTMLNTRALHEENALEFILAMFSS